jgi:hypothetical protein
MELSEWDENLKQIIWSTVWSTVCTRVNRKKDKIHQQTWKT